MTKKHTWQQKIIHIDSNRDITMFEIQNSDKKTPLTGPHY